MPSTILRRSRHSAENCDSSYSQEGGRTSVTGSPKTSNSKNTPTTGGRRRVGKRQDRHRLNRKQTEYGSMQYFRKISPRRLPISAPPSIVLDMCPGDFRLWVVGYLSTAFSAPLDWLNLSRLDLAQLVKRETPQDEPLESPESGRLRARLNG